MLAIALIVGVPLTFAVLHPGYPVSDVQLNSRDVWVTNGSRLLAGRLNQQIHELNGAVSSASNSPDVFQDGDNAFLYESSTGTLERIDRAFTTLGESTPLPIGAEVSYGGDKFAIVGQKDGNLWTTSAAGKLAFDSHSAQPALKLGKGGAAVVTLAGEVVAVSPAQEKLYRIAVGGTVSETAFPVPVKFELSAVGDQAVVLDLSKNRLVKQDGSAVALPSRGLRLQQVGAAAGYALVASGNSLMKVSLDGSGVETVDARIAAPVSAGQTSAPVFLEGCDYAAWAGVQRYLAVCDGQKATVKDIAQIAKDSRLEFRVNRSVIALNNLDNGNIWLVKENLRLVKNWDEVIPPKQDDAKDGTEKSAQQSFEDTIAQRTEQNRPPVALDDSYGVRPGRTTILPVLADDTDPDGDVLTVISNTDVSETAGRLEYIDGARALQYTPAPGASGSVSFRYTVSDGRPGGVASAQVNITVRPLDQNLAPVSNRVGAVSVEVGQSVSYNVLSDWIDPDGDDLQLTAATPTSGDTVRFTPDGFVTFQSVSSELGQRQVNFQVSDGTATATGVLTVEVKAAGTLAPIGTPDFATTFVGDTVVVSPLKNDVSRSGAPLTLLAVKSILGDATFTPNLDRGTVQVSASTAGSYYLEYTLGAGQSTSVGLIRVDVTENPAKPLAPIAVKDAGYLRGSEPTTIPVLDNDISPSGRVLAVQTVEVPSSVQGLSVEILNNTVLRVTSATPLQKQIQLSCTVSDGFKTATAGVTIVPVAPAVKHQAPVAVDDQVTVRAGDIASVSVLANDFHPDGAPMTLDPELPDAGSAGFAFITGNQVRFQAPSTPGVYSVTYKVDDPFQESAVAKVLFTVTAATGKNDRAPVPVPVTARAFAGSTVRVNIPLDGIDPDGDSVYLSSFPGTPTLGDIVEQGSDHFTYKAYSDSAGTDSFSYEVVDSYGKSATGSIQIGVIPRSGTELPPTAVNDSIAIRPGRVASVDALANDSDSNGYSIQIEPKSLVVPKGIKAEVVDNRVVVTAPNKEGSFAIGYTLTNGHAGTSTATINVTVSKDAPLQYPTAVDHVLQVKEIAGKRTVQVHALDNAQNPGGLVSDLKVKLVGPNAKLATVSASGVVLVTPGKTRQAIAYSLTNTIDKLTASAFIIVPPDPGDSYGKAPRIKPGLAPQFINANETKTWNLKDVVYVPSGRDAIITSKSTVVAKRSNGVSAFKDDTTLSFTPEKDYRGQASVQFEVTDGASGADPKGNKALLTLNFTVGDPNFEDQVPTFTPPKVSVEAGGSATVDLRQATSHPSRKVLNAITYSSPTGSTAAVGATVSGSMLTITSPHNAKIGSVVKLKFTLSYKSFTVGGSATATVVSSTKPLPQAVTDPLHAKRNAVIVVHPLDNDVNPFPDTPLRIVSAQLENPASGATLSNTDSTITVTPGPSFIGDVSIVYTVQDATDDSTRRVAGRVIVTVWDVPDQQAAPTIVGTSDGRATIRFSPPPSINGSPVASYAVRSSPAVTPPACTAGADCTFTGLSNGTPYNFYVTATNEVGSSAESPASAIATPYKIPGAPTGATLRAESPAPSTLTMSWAAPADNGGGSISYHWQFTQGASDAGTTGGTSAAVGGKAAGTYSFYVQACNPAGCGGWSSPDTAVVSAPRTATASDGGTDPVRGNPFHLLNLTVSNFPSGNYSVACYANGTNGGTAPYATFTLAIPANGTITTQCYGKVLDASNPGWFKIEIVGVMFTPNYVPWT